jgi:quercetin dioxygenase-like cupin family protein
MPSDDGTLWSKYMQRADGEIARVQAGRNLITRDECPRELTELGWVRWYLNPDLDEPTVRSLYRFELEIAPGSRSGRWFHQGGVIHYVLEGEGYTVVDGAQHDWEVDDVIAIPVRVEGITFQHFNTGTTPVRLLVTLANLDSAIGPAGGVAMSVTEPAPEYAAAHA